MRITLIDGHIRKNTATSLVSKIDEALHAANFPLTINPRTMIVEGDTRYQAFEITLNHTFIDSNQLTQLSDVSMETNIGEETWTLIGAVEIHYLSYIDGNTVLGLNFTFLKCVKCERVPFRDLIHDLIRKNKIAHIPEEHFELLSKNQIIHMDALTSDVPVFEYIP